MNNNITCFNPYWEGTFDRVGFGATLPSRDRILELHQEFAEVAAHWSKRQILTVMGVLNAYIYRAAIDTQSLRKEGRLHRSTRRLMAIAQQGIELFNITLQGTCTYLKEHWQSANYGKTTIWKIRDLLADAFNLFSYQKQEFQAGDRKRGTAPDLENFDFVKALILYEYLEELYCVWHHQELEGLPKHRGAIVRLIYNTVFKDIKRFRRKLPEGVVGYDLYGCEIYRKDYQPTLIPDENGVLPELIEEEVCQNPSSLNLTPPKGDSPGYPAPISVTNGAIAVENRSTSGCAGLGSKLLNCRISILAITLALTGSHNPSGDSISPIK